MVLKDEKKYIVDLHVFRYKMQMTRKLMPPEKPRYVQYDLNIQNILVMNLDKRTEIARIKPETLTKVTENVRSLRRYRWCTFARYNFQKNIKQKLKVRI